MSVVVNIIKLLSSAVGTTLLSNHLYTTLTSIYGFIDYLRANEKDTHTDIKSLLNEIKIMDLEVKIHMITLVLSKKQMNESNEVETLFIKSLEDLLKEIEANTSKIHRTIEEHKLKWFQSWRGLYIDQEVQELKRLNKILEGRITLGSQFGLIS
jgi:hypothetical protein